jgi:hypothetical protein
MNALEELVQLFAAAGEEIRPRIAPPDLIRTWQRIGDRSKWQAVMFGKDSENMLFDELDRAVGAPIGTLREAWAIARSRAGQT